LDNKNSNTELIDSFRTNPMRYIFRKLTFVVFRYIHTRKATRRISINGRPFDVYPHVFNPKYSKFLNFEASEYLAEHLTVYPGEKVLDMGTGIGVQAVFAALSGGNVIATDIYDGAVECARHNVALNRLEKKIEVRHGDLFQPVASDKFDLIIWLTPSFFSEPEDSYQYGWMCGKDGHVLGDFFDNISNYLTDNGRIIFSCVDRSRKFIQYSLKKNGFFYNEIAPPKNRFPLETITLYEARKIKLEEVIT